MSRLHGKFSKFKHSQAGDFGGVVFQDGSGAYDPRNNVSFAGEHHGRVLTPFNKGGVPIGSKYNFLGPGTQIQQRDNLIQTAGISKPINDLDRCAYVHDNEYLQAGKQYEKDKNKPAFMGRVKEADYRFRECAKNSKDDPITAKIAEKSILAKEIAETSGLIDSKTFSGKGEDVPAKKIIQKVKRAMKAKPVKEKKIRKTKSRLLEENEALKKELSRQVGKGKECEDNLNCDCEDCVKKELKEMRKKVPASKIRESLKPKSAPLQQGGFLQVLIPVLASLAGTAVGKIFDKVFEKKGSGVKLTAEDKRNLLIEQAQNNPQVAYQLSTLLNI